MGGYSMRSCWPGLANWPVLYTSIHSLVLGPTLYTPLHSVGASTKPLVLASTLCLCGPYGTATTAHCTRNYELTAPYEYSYCTVRL